MAFANYVDMFSEVRVAYLAKSKNINLPSKKPHVDLRTTGKNGKFSLLNPMNDKRHLED